MKKSKKVFAAVVATSMVFGTALTSTSCSLFKGKEAKSEDAEETIEEIATDYFDKLVDGKYDKAGKLTSDGKAPFEDETKDFSDDDMDLLDEIISSSEIEVKSVKVKSEKADCKVTVTAADAEADVTLKFELDEDEEEWLISDDSEVVEFYLGEFDKVGGTGVSDEEALDAVNAIMDDICAADMESMYKVFQADGEKTYEEYLAGIEENPSYDFIIACLKDMTYTSEVTDHGDDYVQVTVTGKMVDIQQVMDNTLTEDFMVRLLASYIANTTEYDATTLICQEAVATIPTVSDRMDVTFVFNVTKVDGEVSVESVSVSDLMEEVNIDTTKFDDRQDEITIMAIDYAHDNGMVDDATYEALMVQYAGYYPSESEITIVEGSDFSEIAFYSDSTFTNEVSSYASGDAGVYIKFRTNTLYSADSHFYVDAYIDGELVVDKLEGSVRGDLDTNWGDISLNGPLQPGDFEIVITGFDGNEFADVKFVVE